MKKTYEKPLAELLESIKEPYLADALSAVGGGFFSAYGSADNDIGDEW